MYAQVGCVFSSGSVKRLCLVCTQLKYPCALFVLARAAPIPALYAFVASSRFPFASLSLSLNSYAPAFIEIIG